MKSKAKLSKNWHKADIIAALKKKGLSLAQLSRSFGLSSSTLRNALDRKWPKGERLIAQAIGVPAKKIWPQRYLAGVDRRSSAVIRSGCASEPK